MQALPSFAGDAVGSGPTGFAALLLAFWAVGAHNDRGGALAGVAIGFASIAVITYRDVRIDAGAGVAATLAGCLVTFVAYTLQRRSRRATALEERAVRLEREREQDARAAVAEERRRIARDLHDVVAHSVSVMTVQAGAARLLLDEEPERARAPLLAVEETGRQALAEMRRLLGILRTEEGEPALAPQPGLADLERLLEQARGAGLPVELSLEGQRRPLAPGVDLAGYRIVQEALTNAIKHAGPARAHVAVRYAPEALELEITNDGRTGANGGEGGHGLVGMRERAALYGGELEAGRRDGGGFIVRARLPARGGRNVIRVLIADDQALVRGGFRMILEAQKDIEVVGEASDGREALARARELAPDVVLMDIRMPELDGLEATRRLWRGRRDARAHPHHLRRGRVRLRRHEGRRQRLPAQGRPPRAARRGGPRRRCRRRAARAGDHAPPDRGLRPPPGSGLRRAGRARRAHASASSRSLKLVARGLSNAEIAAALFLSEATVKTHVTHILAKLRLRDRVQAVVLAYECGLVQPGVE